MPPPDITSTSNSRIKRLVGLRRRENRDQEAVFVVEGATAIHIAIRAGLHPTEVYHDPAVFADPPFPASEIFSVSTEALDRASYRGHGQGVIAVFEQFDVGLGSLSLGPEPILLLVEGIEKPGNLGAMLRTADSIGADAVIAADPGTDPFNPNVVRASIGALFTVPLAVAELEEALAWLEEHRVRVVAADPSGGVGLWDADLTGPVALLIGSEHSGLTAEAFAGADLLVSIPMEGSIDSLNASVSAAVLAYEALRQRSGPPTHHPASEKVVPLQSGATDASERSERVEGGEGDPKA
jgi:TrmH family RNA methyltransferase